MPSRILPLVYTLQSRLQPRLGDERQKMESYIYIYQFSCLTMTNKAPDHPHRYWVNVGHYHRHKFRAIVASFLPTSLPVRPWSKPICIFPSYTVHSLRWPYGTVYIFDFTGPEQFKSTSKNRTNTVSQLKHLAYYRSVFCINGGKYIE